MILQRIRLRMRHSRPAGLRAKTIGGVAVLLGMLLAISAVLVIDSWLSLQGAERAELRDALAGDLASAALELARERGLTAVAVTAPPRADRPDASDLAQQRTVVDRVFSRVRDRLAQEPGIVSMPVQRELVAGLDRLRDLRDRLNAELAKPVELRDAAVFSLWLSTVSGLTEIVRHAIGEQNAPSAQFDASLQTARELRMAAFDLRNAAGERSALLWNLTSSGRAADLETAVQIGSRAEATELLWRRVDRLARALADVRVTKAVDAARQGYLGPYAAMLEEMAEAGLSGAPGPVDESRFGQATRSAMQLLDELVLASQTASTDMLRDRVRRARLALLGSIAMVLAGVVVAAISVTILHRRVLRPIEQVTGAMRRLVAGWESDAPLPTAQSDEIGEMSRAIAAFRDAMLASEIALNEAERFAHQTMDSLASCIAVLDGTGVIVASNRQWREFGKARAHPRIARDGENYLAACDAAAAGGDPEAQAIADGIRSVIRGERGSCEIEYPCHGPGERRWFRMTTTPFARTGQSPPCFVVAHEDITARKLAEEAVQERNRLLELAERMAATGHWRYDRQSGALRWSREIYRIYGLEPSDRPPDPQAALAAYHPEDREALQRAVQLAAEQGSPFSLDLRLRRSDGELRVVEVLGDCERQEDGRIVAVFGVFRDITERKQAAERLANLNLELERRVAEQTAVLRRAQELAGVGHWSWAKERVRGAWHTGLEYSSAVAALFGVAAAELAVSDEDYIARFVHPDDRGAVAEEFRNYVERRRERRPLEYRIVRPDGSVRHIREVTENVPADSGHPDEVLGTIQDITERKEAELRLRRSEAHLRAIFDHAPVTISLRDVAGRYVMVNRRFREIFGRPESEIVGRTPEQFYPERFLATIRRGVDHVRREKTTIITEEDAPTVDGDRRYLTTRFPILGERGELSGIGAISVDVTAERAAEAAQRAVEEQLRQARKMEAIGRLTGGVAHDFNNLLGVIVGNLDLLSLKLAGSSTEKELVERAIAAAERGAALTHRLLAFARRQTLLPQNVDVGHLVTEMVQLLRRTIGERVALRTEIDPDLRPCYVDPAQLETALLNLCLNARDAMPAGGVLTVAARNEMAVIETGSDAASTSEPFVVVSVSDTGTGMSPETRARAFEPFFTTKGVGKGSGLGLSMVYGFVEQSGGHVEIDSEPGIGTTVRLHLPASAAPAREAAEDVAVSDPRGAGQLVLVVEDDDRLRAFALDALRGLGYRVVEAADGPAALAALHAHDDIAALFTDIILPGPFDGFELARRVRALRPDIRVLYTSGFSDAERLPAELIDGESELLPKPYRINELGRRIGRLFSEEAAAAQE